MPKSAQMKDKVIAPKNRKEYEQMLEEGKKHDAEMQAKLKAANKKATKKK